MKKRGGIARAMPCKTRRAASIINQTAAVARKTLRQLYQTHREYAGIDGAALENAVQRLGEDYTALQEINAQLIRAFVRQRFLQQVELSNRSPAQLTEDQKKFKMLQLEARHIEQLENYIDKLQESLKPLENFILPGGSEASAVLMGLYIDHAGSWTLYTMAVIAFVLGTLLVLVVAPVVRKAKRMPQFVGHGTDAITRAYLGHSDEVPVQAQPPRTRDEGATVIGPVPERPSEATRIPKP